MTFKGLDIHYVQYGKSNRHGTASNPRSGPNGLAVSDSDEESSLDTVRDFDILVKEPILISYPIDEFKLRLQRCHEGAVKMDLKIRWRSRGIFSRKDAITNATAQVK